MPIICLRDVAKCHHRGQVSTIALDGVTLTVAGGEYLGVFGPSGSGKSTLLNVMAGLEVPDRGAVEVLGVDLCARTADERARLRRRRIGVVYQSFNLLPSLTLAENVVLPLLLDGWSRERAETRAISALREVGLHARLDHRPCQISGGEAQRAAIARALVIEPRLILADEPTGNLDSAQGDAMLRMLRELGSDRGGAVVVATHDPQAVKWCDRIIELRDGRVVVPQADDPCRRQTWATG